MAVRFPAISRAVDPPEREVNYLFDHLTECCRHGQGQGELWYPNGVAIDSDTNQIYVTEGCYTHERNPKSVGHHANFTRVSIFAETGVFLEAFSHKIMECAYGIAIHKGNVYVTDMQKDMLLRFKIKRNFCLAGWLGGRGSGNGQFNSPRQLTVSSDGFVLVTDYGNDRIKILDSNLFYQRHISHDSMRSPCDVKVTSDEVFVLCQTFDLSPSVKIFSYSGNLIRSIITDRQIFHYNPRFFCLDADSNLLLNNSTNDEIQIFSREGTLLHPISTRIFYGMYQSHLYKEPAGIVLTNNLKLAFVCKDHANRLQIYSMST